MNEVTRIINAIEQGDARAVEKLLPLVYDELRILAAQKMAKEKPGQTLQATALVHEAYLRLAESGGGGWNSRGHFFKAAAEAMRRILVENARRKRSLKGGGEYQKVGMEQTALPDVVASFDAASDDILAIDEALEKFAEKDPENAELVQLRYFSGLTLDQIAEIKGISRRTATRWWTYARAWLRREIDGEGDSPL